jgi:LysR family hydrogen peroxide-inducible transcriptional activator
MNIRDLEYALMVAELGHFSRAAEACHVSQPALSGQIQKLEQHLGVTLFERTKRKVRITPVGEDILRHARDILALVTVIEETASARKDPLSGPLRLGMIPTIAPYLTPLLLPSLRHGLPKMELSLTEGMTHVLEKQLLEGEIDAAVLATRVLEPQLAEIALYTEPFWIALPHGHAMEDQDTVSIFDIQSEDLLLLADGHCLRDQVLSFCERTLVTNPAFNTQNTSLATILALVGAGMGVTLVPAMSLQGSWVTDAGIAVRRETSGQANRSVTLAYRKSFPRRQMLEKLADIVCAILPDTVTPERR